MDNIQGKWEKRSTVRSRPRIVYDKYFVGNYYPISNVRIATHPIITSKESYITDFILIQSLYKYSNDIASIETRVVNEIILKAISDNIEGISLTDNQKLSLYTIMIDESYHAYVAFDAMMQIRKETNINPLELPKVIEIEKAIYC